MELRELAKQVAGNDPMYLIVSDTKIIQEMQSSKFLVVLKHFFWHFLQQTSETRKLSNEAVLSKWMRENEIDLNMIEPDTVYALNKQRDQDEQR
jgi:hypothetical protein